MVTTSENGTFCTSAGGSSRGALEEWCAEEDLRRLRGEKCNNDYIGLIIFKALLANKA